MKALLIVLLPALAGCAVERVWGYPEYGKEAAPAPPLTCEAVLRLVQAKIPEETILERIRTCGMASRPGPAEIVWLKKNCVSDRILEAMATAPLPPAWTVPPATRLIEPEDFPFGGPGCFGPCGSPHGVFAWEETLRP